jgi:hypothetical protein
MLQLEDLKALPDFLTVEKFAEICEVSPRTVERWMLCRRIDSLKVAGAVRVPKLEVLRMLAVGYRTRQLL